MQNTLEKREQTRSVEEEREKKREKKQRQQIKRRKSAYPDILNRPHTHANRYTVK